MHAPVCTSGAAGKKVGFEQHGFMPIKLHEEISKAAFLCKSTASSGDQDLFNPTLQYPRLLEELILHLQLQPDRTVL
jgi:hypothetical protein